MNRKKLVVALLMLFTAGCATMTPGQPPLDQSKVDEIADHVQKVRQLSFVKPVTLIVETHEQLQARVEAEMMLNYTDEQLRYYAAAGTYLGRYPSGVDLKTKAIHFAHDHVMGKYEPATGEMVLITRRSPSRILEGRMGRMFLAHECVHALQDQHFNLDRDLAKLQNNDQAKAFRLVGEGDATIAEYAYDAGKMDLGVLDYVTSHVQEPGKGPDHDVHGLVEGRYITAYADGIHFVAEAYRRGGLNAVNALYSKPPLSMHQILHPADYFDHPRPPVPIMVGGYETKLPAWITLQRDTYGEGSLKDILERNLGAKAPEVALAEQWAGDQVVILRSSDGKLAVIWMVVFVSPDSATRFATAYTRVLDKLLGNTEHQLALRNDAVLVIAGVPTEDLTQAIWAGSSIGPQTETTSAK